VSSPKHAPAGSYPVRLSRFVAAFVFSIAAGFGLLLAPFAKPATTWFSGVLAMISGILIALTGGNAQVNGVILTDPTSGFAIQLANGCNGVHAMIQLWSAVLAFPASWPQKLKGLLAGSVAIHAVNLLRVVSLFYLGPHHRTLFDFMHNYLWESLIMLEALVFFWIWVQRVFATSARYARD
jgi:exosortase H (IPTLxxWG-CTERM-specific)